MKAFFGITLLFCGTFLALPLSYISAKNGDNSSYIATLVFIIPGVILTLWSYILFKRNALKDDNKNIYSELDKYDMKDVESYLRNKKLKKLS